MMSDEFIDSIIKYFETKKAQLQHAFDVNVSERNSHIHKILTFFGLFLTIFILIFSVITPLFTTMLGATVQTASQQQSEMIKLLQTPPSIMTEHLMNVTTENMNRLSESVTGQANNWKIILVLLGSGLFIGAAIFLGLLFHYERTYDKKLGTIAEDITTELNIIMYLYIFKVRYADKLKQKQVKEALQKFYLPSTQYMEKLETILNNETEK